MTDNVDSDGGMKKGYQLVLPEMVLARLDVVARATGRTRTAELLRAVARHLAWPPTAGTPPPASPTADKRRWHAELPAAIMLRLRLVAKANGRSRMNELLLALSRHLAQPEPPPLDQPLCPFKDV